MMIAPNASTLSQGAVIATRPAKEAFRHIDTSGLPYRNQVKIIQDTVATAGAIVVVTKMEPSCEILVAAAPLNPYQPSHKINTPRAPIVKLCPGIAFTLMLPSFLLFVYLPIRGPNSLAPTKADKPPTIWIAQEPAKSWKPNCANQPPPQIQCASIG